MSPADVKALNQASREQLVDTLAYVAWWIDSFYDRQVAPIRSGTAVIVDHLKKYESRIR